MSHARTFSYDGLFAESVPGPQKRVVARKCKYDFGTSCPPPESLPIDGLVESLERALQEEGRGLAVYPHLQGYLPLREFIARRLASERDIHVSPDDIFLGSGSGQPIRMIAEALLDPGDVVLMEHAVYGGTVGNVKRYGAEIRGVLCDDEGMLPDELESAIQAAIAQGKRPKLIYTIPTFQNPQGWDMTLERRQELVRLSQRYDVPILEDDCYIDLRFEGEPVTSIRSMDDTGRVMYVGSFSKVLWPSLRLGYMVAPPQVLDQVAAIKSGGGVNQFTALAVHRFCTAHLEDHINVVNDILRVKRDAMLAALGEHMGSAATWSRPPGGLYVWLQMGEEADLVTTLETALEADVNYHTGPSFAPDGVSFRNCARLCYGFNTPDEIREGIGRLAEVFEKEGILEA